MNDYTTIGLLMVLGTICICTITAVFFGCRAAAQQSVMTHSAALMGVVAEQQQKERS